MKDSDIHRSLRGERKKKRSPFKKFILALTVIFAVIFCGAAAGFMGAVMGGLPDVSQTMTPDASSQIFDRKGRLITTVHAEQNRLPVPLSQVPKNLQNAFIAAEDVRFYEHHGIDPRGILRALYNNIVHRDATGQGGSTITQQLARNAFLTQDQTIKRKLLEAVLAIEIERKYTKDEILQMYMNQIYFGQGAYGIQTASKVYFGKDVKDLDLAQSALIAGLPNSPNYYSPFRSVEAAKSRQAVVLDQMAKYGYITQAEAAAAKKADLHLAKPDASGTGETASYFISYIVQILSDKYDSESIYKEGLKVYTTLDLDMQRDAETAVKRQLPKGSKDKNGLTQPQGALISIETKTGAIRAMVGGRGEDHFNRAVQMVRQPGSSFKPFTYVTALEKGMSAGTSLSNRKVTYAGGWTPKNYDGTYGGDVSLETALVNSLNVPTIDLANKVGMRNVLQTAKSMGITTLVESGPANDDNLAASIGGLTKGVTLWDMAKAYSVFANDGKLIEPNAIVKVLDRDGNVLEDHEGMPAAKQVLQEDAVHELNAILQDAVLHGTGGGAYIGRPMAGKTGTTDDEHDAWFVGYTPDLVTAVWIGDDTSSNAGYTGGTIPASIWKDYMTQATANTPQSKFNLSAAAQQRIAAAQAQAQKAAEDKKKAEDAAKKKTDDKKAPVDKVKEAAKQAGSQLLDRISGKVKGEE